MTEPFMRKDLLVLFVLSAGGGGGCSCWDTDHHVEGAGLFGRGHNCCFHINIFYTVAVWAGVGGGGGEVAQRSGPWSRNPEAAGSNPFSSGWVSGAREPARCSAP